MGKQGQGKWQSASWELWRGSYSPSSKAKATGKPPWKRPNGRAGEESAVFPAYDTMVPQQEEALRKKMDGPVIDLEDPQSGMVPSVQKALNMARKAEQRLVKLQKERATSEQQWAAWVRSAKAAYLKERNRHAKTLETFDTDIAAARTSQKEAREMVCLAVDASRKEQAPMEIVEDNTWDEMIAGWDQEQEEHFDGVLRRAMAEHREALQRTPARASAHIPQTPQYGSRSPAYGPDAHAGYAAADGQGPRVDPYPVVTPLRTGPPQEASRPSPPPPGLESTSPHPPSAKDRRPPREEARKDIKSASKTPPQSSAGHGHLADKLQAKRHAMSAFGIPPGATLPTVARILEDDEDEVEQMLGAEAPGDVHARPPDDNMDLL